MDPVIIIIAVMTACGAGLIVYALAAPQKGKQADFDIVKAVKAIDDSMTEADTAATELSELSRSVLGEIEGKYQELLFLYSMIDEKKNELMTSGGAKEDEAYKDAVNIVVSDYTPASFTSPRLNEILELKKTGISDAEIAKSLDMGAGEVKLILGLNDLTRKGRRKSG